MKRLFGIALVLALIAGLCFGSVALADDGEDIDSGAASTDGGRCISGKATVADDGVVNIAGPRYKKDSCVADNEDVWNFNGWDDGIQQLGPTGKGCMGAQHPDWTDRDGVWNVAVPTGYNLYRDDVTDTGNLDMVRLRTDTPNEINLDDAYLTKSDWHHWKNCPFGKKPVDDPDCVWFWKLTYESPDTWYWAPEPRFIPR